MIKEILKRHKNISYRDRETLLQLCEPYKEKQNGSRTNSC
jgi:hypothetical protein